MNTGWEFTQRQRRGLWVVLGLCLALIAGKYAWNTWGPSPEVRAAKAQLKEEKAKAAPVVRTTEGVMRQYIESPNPTYPQVFSLSHVQFAGESEEVDDKGKKQLANLAQLLQEYSTLKIAIYGHTSGGGTQEMAQQEKGGLHASKRLESPMLR